MGRGALSSYYGAMIMPMTIVRTQLCGAKYQYSVQVKIDRFCTLYKNDIHPLMSIVYPQVSIHFLALFPVLHATSMLEEVGLAELRLSSEYIPRKSRRQ
jgi:hypothetical protein